MIADRRRPVLSHSATEGLAVAVTVIISAGFCFLAPAYFDAAGRQRTIWFFCGATLALLECLLSVVEADRLTGRRVISDLGFAAIILIFAIATGSLAVKGSFGPWVKGELKAMALLESVVGFWALTGSLLQRKSTRREPEPLSRYPFGISRTAGLIVATLGLLAWIVNILGAMLSLRKI